MLYLISYSWVVGYLGLGLWSRKLTLIKVRGKNIELSIFLYKRTALSWTSFLIVRFVRSHLWNSIFHSACCLSTKRYVIVTLSLHQIDYSYQYFAWYNDLSFFPLFVHVFFIRLFIYSFLCLFCYKDKNVACLVEWKHKLRGVKKKIKKLMSWTNLSVFVCSTNISNIWGLFTEYLLMVLFTIVYQNEDVINFVSRVLTCIAV